MAKRTRDQLKEVFRQYNVPNEEDYHNLLDSAINSEDDGIERPENNPVRIHPEDGEEDILDLYDSTGKAAWRISLRPDDANNEPGFNLATTDTSSRLFVRNLDGYVGIGNKLPNARLHVNGSFRLSDTTKVDAISNSTPINGNNSTVQAERDDTTLLTAKAIMDHIDNMLVGTVSAHATDAVPPGWLECNGQLVSRTTYQRLFNRIGTKWGSGSGTFSLPDLRGQFIRGWGHGGSVDGSRLFADGQSDTTKFHDHPIGSHGHTITMSGGSISNAGDHSHSYTRPSGEATWLADHDKDVLKGTISAETGTAGDHTHTFTGQTATASSANLGSTGVNTNDDETRPTNVSLMYCIKY